MPMPEDPALARLREIIAATGGLLIAFSGGADSTLLAAVAAQVLPRDRLLAVTATGPFFPPNESLEAARLARTLGIPQETITLDHLSLPGLAENPRDRCYHCKSALLRSLTEMASARGLIVAEGSQRDDLGIHRPGRRAVAEAGARTPLAEAGLGKEDVRRISHALGLPTWDRPARPCLATRFPYGTRLTPELLERVAGAERVLAENGFSECRVRDHSDLARLEVPLERLEALLEHREAIASRLRALGFRYVTVDLQGLRSGSMDGGGADENVESGE